MQYLSDDFAISPQITSDEISEVRDQGFVTIFCHRPDREEAGQPDFDDLRNQATSLGLNMCLLPVIPGKITQTDVAAFKVLYNSALKPVLAYCKSGGRAKMLWERMVG